MSDTESPAAPPAATNAVFDPAAAGWEPRSVPPRRPESARTAGLHATGRLERPGIAGRLLEFGEELRGEGVAIGTSELLDAFAALQHVPWTEQVDFREALAATLAKSQDDRRVFELVFDRFFFRAATAPPILNLG